MSIYSVKGLKDFNLDHIFDCGQCFRWEKQEDGSYIGQAFGRQVRMSFDYENESLDCGNLTIYGSDRNDFEKIWKSYLDLDTDYGKIKKELEKKDKIIGEAIKYGSGIRILKQDLWETIVSFIISQNNNIPRIKAGINKLAEVFGEDGNVPTVEKLASLEPEQLEPIRLGYRAKYLVQAARQISEDGFDRYYDSLTELYGVGPKVANCIALFGQHKMNSFPIDVWVKRVMNRLYGFAENDMKGMAKFAEERFGELGGIAQQYLFYYVRWSDLDI